MKKSVFWTGIVLLAIGVIAGFLAGAQSGPSAAESTPLVPILYGTSQVLWMFLGIIGLIIVAVGLIMKKKK